MNTNQPNENLLKAFRRDAVKAARVLEESLQKRDYQLFATTAHAMKSALLNAGCPELSQMALDLEMAGKKGETAYVDSNAHAFIEALESVIEEIGEMGEEDAESGGACEEGSAPAAGTVAGIAFLLEQLRIVELACENRDLGGMRDALARIEDTELGEDAKAVFREIGELALEQGDFQKAGSVAGDYFRRVIIGEA